jgi:hypothetical protein
MSGQIWVDFTILSQVKERTTPEVAESRDGAELVSVIGMKSTPDEYDPDWPLYPETILNFRTTPPIEIDLRAPVSEATVMALKSVGFGQPFAIMTAYDPEGRNLPRSENERRKRALDERLRNDGFTFVDVDCCSPDRTHCEVSVAVTMQRKDAIRVARELQQVAIFWFDGKSFWILGALIDTDPLMLPRSS